MQPGLMQHTPTPPPPTAQQMSRTASGSHVPQQAGLQPVVNAKVDVGAQEEGSSKLLFCVVCASNQVRPSSSPPPFGPVSLLFYNIKKRIHELNPLWQTTPESVNAGPPDASRRRLDGRLIRHWIGCSSSRSSHR